MSSSKSRWGAAKRRDDFRKSRAPSARPAGGQRTQTHGPSSLDEGPLFYFVLYLVFLAVALFVYAPTLSGDFLSDDNHYVVHNRYVRTPTLASLTAILDPTGVPANLVENYAPVHLLLHAVEWQLFGTDVRGYHIVNVSIHALASLLLVMLFRRHRVSLLASSLAGGLFLLHPANVEAVAWISQLKTSASLALCVGALLVQRKRPALGTVLFALALFAKPTAAVALSTLALSTWFENVRQDRTPDAGASRGGAGPWIQVSVWLLIFIVFAIAEFWAFNKTAGQAPVLYEDPWVRMRTTCAISLRYIVMAFSGRGLSTFHEPPAAESLFDPWWLGSLVVLALLAYRMVVTLMRKEDEAIFWVWAAGSFAPVAGVIPLPYPMADRYLYYILPGLMGGVLLAGPPLARHFSSALGLTVAPQRARQAVAVLCLLGMFQFASATRARSLVWLNNETMMADAELHYPEGLPAQTRIAHRKAAQGDAEAAVAALRAANRRGYNRLDHLISDPAYDRISSDPGFQKLLREIAQSWLDRFLLLDDPSQEELQTMAQAYIVLDDIPAAIDSIERALAREGLLTEELQRNLEDLRRTQRIRESVKSRGSRR